MQILPITPPLTGFWKNTNSEEIENLGSFSKDKHKKKRNYLYPWQKCDLEQSAKGCQERNCKIQCK